MAVTTLLIGYCQAASVDLGGWKFTTNIEGWRTGTDTLSVVNSYDSSSPDWEHPCETNALTGTWKGLVRLNSFVFPAYPNAPKDNEMYGFYSSRVDIYLVKIPYDVKKGIETQDIAVYGSLSNVPDDRKMKDLREILTDATRIPVMCVPYDSEKDIQIADREAHLSEHDWERGGTTGVIAIQLDNDTIGVIDAPVNLDKGSKSSDWKYYDGRAWDFIDSLKISKS